MADDLSIQVKEQPIIIQFTKQGIQGATGATGPQGRDGDVWELQLTMTAVPNGTLTMKLYLNGELCTDQHYAFVQYMTNEGTAFAVSSGWSKNFTGNYSFTYTGMRAFFVIVYEDAFMERVICANSVNYGKAATVRVGNVQSGAVASVTNSGTIYDAVLNFVLPKGDKGEVVVDSTVTLPAGTPAYVQDLTPNDPTKATLKFGIPNGASAGARYVPDPYSPTQGNEIIIDAGWYYEPSVDTDGILSWTNNAALPNPDSVQIAIHPVGEWESSTAYKRLDLVYNAGNGYLAKHNVTAGTALTNTTYWLKIVDKGDKGDAATISAGSATVLPEGSNPTVTNSGDSHAAVFNFGIPKGDKGDAATVTVGSVTTLASGEQARVTNSGTAYAAVLNFAIPQGPHGVGIHSSYEDEYIYFESGTHLDWGEIQGSLANQSDLQNALNLKAPLASPNLTGTPTAPTATAGTNTTQIATTAFVQGEISNLGEMAFVDDAESDTKAYGRKDGDWYDLDNRYYTEAEVDNALDAKVNETVVASEFDEHTAYPAGSYCLHNNILYRFTIPSQNAWNSAETEEILTPEFDDTLDYLAGEYVLYNDNYYIFTSAHTTTASPWNANDVSQIGTEFDSEQAYEIGDYVTYNNALYQYTSAHVSGAFDESETDEISYDEFDATRDYAIGDVVTYNDAYYIFTSAHIAESEWDSEDATQITVGTFDDTQAYGIGDYVIYNDTLYQFTSEHAEGDFDESEVDEITADDFDSTQDYEIGDICIYEGDYYIFTSAHVAESSWDDNDVNQLTTEIFDSTHAYGVGDYVEYDDALYQFTSAHVSGAFDSTEVSAITADTFDSTQNYEIGDICIYDGNYYIFTSAHEIGAWNDAEVEEVETTGFVTNTAYSNGDYVTYRDKLYQYTTDHSATASWDASRVTAVTVGQELRRIAESGGGGGSGSGGDGSIPSGMGIGDIIDFDGDTMVITTAENSISDLQKLTAPIFSTLEDYSVGDYVIYNNKLYRFVRPHYAGIWSGGEAIAVNVAEELIDIKSNGGGGSGGGTSNSYTKTETDFLLSGKEDTLTFDTTPTNSSTNPVTSGGIKTALDSKADETMLTESVESSMTATKNYTAGKLMIVDNKLLRATTDITNGSAITVGTNAEEIDLETLIDNKLDITSWKTTGGLDISVPGTTDVTKADNNISSVKYHGLSVADSNNLVMTRYETEVNPDGKVKSIWYIRNYDTAGNIKGSKGIQMIMDKSGNLTWSVHEPANFRTAIGAAAEIDSGWLTATNSSTFTGTIYYRKVGKMVEVTAYDIKSTTDLSASTGKSLGQIIPSGYRPNKNETFAMRVHNNSKTASGFAMSDGYIYIYAPDSVNLTTSDTLCFTAMYFI